MKRSVKQKQVIVLIFLLSVGFIFSFPVNAAPPVTGDMSSGMIADNLVMVPHQSVQQNPSQLCQDCTDHLSVSGDYSIEAAPTITKIVPSAFYSTGDIPFTIIGKNFNAKRVEVKACNRQPNGQFSCHLVSVASIVQKSSTKIIGKFGSVAKYKGTYAITVTNKNGSKASKYIKFSQTKSKITSSAFQHMGEIPAEYTCSGSDVSPPISWGSAPPLAKSYVLIVDDPDAPEGVFTHWIAYNIPVARRSFAENIPRQVQLPDGTRQGKNDFWTVGYEGPCPPPGNVHRYYFRIYALDTTLSLTGDVYREQILKAMKGHVIQSGILIGTFQRL